MNSYQTRRQRDMTRCLTYSQAEELQRIATAQSSIAVSAATETVLCLYDVIMDLTHAEARYAALLEDSHADIFDKMSATLTYHQFMDEARALIMHKCIGE
jgi:hypothetical protein